MEQLNKLEEVLEDSKFRITEGKPLSEEAFAEWKSSPITKLFMIDIKMSQLEAIQQRINFSGNDEMSAKAKGIIESFEFVLEWTPIEEEDDSE